MFNLETALATWRRTLETHRTFTAEDIEELEHHIRDEVHGYLLEGIDEETAFHRALHEMGRHGVTTEEYRKVYLNKLPRHVAHARAHLTELTMLHNYLKIAYRTLRKHKGYAALNIIGLAVGLASCILILLYTHHERTYDAFHAHAEDTYLIYKERHTAQGVRELDDTWPPMLAEMQQTIPGIEVGTRVWHRERWLQAGDTKVQANITFADSTFLDVFSFALQAGDPQRVLRETSGAVLSKGIAQQLFGDTDPMGQTFTYDFNQTYEVTGMLAEVPSNSSVGVDIIIPAHSISLAEERLPADWNGSFLFTWVRLAGQTTPEAVEARFPEMLSAVFGDEGPNSPARLKLKLTPLADYYNRSTDSNRTTTLLLLIALGIILIACINFINLATARAVERAREVGMRKVLGAHRRQLIQQFLGESLVTVTLAFAVGLAIAWACLPTFNSVVGLDLSLFSAANTWLFGWLVALWLGIGLLAGGYPAFVLAQFEPVATVKGNVRSSQGGQRLRQGLVVAQFALSILLLIGTVGVWMQVQYMQSRDLSFDGENVVVIPTSQRDFADAETAAAQIATTQQEVRQVPGVISVASSMEVPSRAFDANTFVWPEGWTSEEPVRMRFTYVDDHYFDTYGMTLVAGRRFDANRPSDAEAMIINETAMRDMGWTTATVIGKAVNDMEVIGVIADYHYESLENAVRGTIHRYQPPEGRNHRFVSVKIAGGDVQATLAGIEAVWQTLDPGRSFEFFFIDDDFGTLYERVERVSTLVGYFTLSAILLAGLGLLAMTSYTVVQRTKEIGVRKVLGASVGQISGLLLRQFAQPVLWANLLAWPLAYFFLSQWLQDFAYRIAVPWWLFPVAALGALATALALVSYHAIRASRANPIRALRYE
ncbi:MAG: ABC transporter permease [Bacteroidota bacterium]